MAWRPIVKCPVCGTVMPWAEFEAGKPWICPDCSRRFQPSRVQSSIKFFSTVVLAFSVSYVLGWRGMRLLVISAALWFPPLLICVFASDFMVPIRLEPYRQRKSDSKDSG